MRFVFGCADLGFLVVSCNLNFTDVLNDVVVRDDVAAFIEDESGAHPVECPFGVGRGSASAFLDFVSLDEDDRAAVSLKGFCCPV